MILVTGATGTTGSLVVRMLHERGEDVRAMSRRPARGAVRADFDDPASLDRAVDGVSAVYLVTTPPSPTVDHDEALVRAARAAGVERIVKLGAISGEEPGTWHHLAEQPTRTSGLAWTVLRPPSFASNVLGYARMIAAGAPVPNPTGTGRAGVVDPRDIAAVAVAALTQDGHAGRTWTLTGPELLSLPEQIAILGQVLGRHETTADLTPEEIREAMLAAGMAPAAADEATAGMVRQAAGRYAVLTDDVQRVLGRPPTSFRDWAREHRSAF